MQLGSSPTTGTPARTRWSERADRPPEHPPRGRELSGRDPGEPAAERPFGEGHREPRVLEHFHRGPADRGVEEVRERVRPQHHGATSGRRPPAREPRPERPVREAREIAAPVEATQPLHRGAQHRRVRHAVQHAGCERCEPGEDREPTHRVVRRRAEPARVVVSQELGLVGRHVDVDRAIAQAALAGEAQVERVPDGFGAPPFGDHVALQHLEQQASPPARRVLLVARHHVARAHRAALGPPALAHADAPEARSAGEAVLRVGIPEEGDRLGRGEVGAEAQVRVERVGFDDAPRVHPVVRIPDRLERSEGPDDPLAVHPREELGAGLAVAVLARERSAVRGDEVGRVFHEAAEGRDALRAPQVEVDAGVHAGLTEVAVERSVEAVAVVETAQVAQVVADALGRNGGVLPPGPRVDAAGLVRGRAQPGLADLPDLVLLLGVVEELHRRRRVRRGAGAPSARGPSRPLRPSSTRRTPRGANRRLPA